MAAAVSLELEGADEVVAMLRRLPKTVGKKHMRRAIRQGIVLVRQTIKATAPQRAAAGTRGVRRGQKQTRPGRLRRLVRVKARRGKPGYLKVSLIYPTEGASDNPKNAFYWRFVEFGTRIHTANPFIQRAVDINFQGILRHVINETNKGLREELNKAKST